jgi:hypothetical protein
MNGRIYDPKLGRFLQADPIVQALTFSQSLNRYSYGFNSPLSGTDSEITGGKFANGAATDSFGYTLTDVIVGLSDSYIKTITFGLGDLSAVRRVLGIQGAIDKDSAAYRGGSIAGQAVGIVLGVAAVVRGAIAGIGDFVLLLGLELSQGK